MPAGNGPSSSQTAEPDAGVNVCPRTGALWGYTLSFYDRTLEGRYQLETVQRRHRHEKALHLVDLVAGIVMNFIHWDSLSAAARAHMLVTFVVLPAIPAYMAWFKKNMYMQMRTVLVTMVTLHYLFFACVTVENPVDQTWYHILGWICLESPTIVAFLTCTNWSLCFRHQALLQVLTLPGLFAWASMFCTSCESSEMDFDEGFANLGAIVRLIPAFVGLTSPKESLHGCLEVTFTVVVIAGFLLPVLLVYSLDTHRRAEFASHRMPPHMVAILDQNASDSLCVAVLYFAVAVEMVVLSSKMSPFTRIKPYM